jgi:hypothetical protein
VIFIEESPREAKSFTDETSPHKPPTSDRKVSIHGQVIRDLPLGWFHDLMKLYPGEKPEVKSSRILEEFHALPTDFKDRIWVGMKKVIINIVDSLSYQLDYRKILANVYKHDKAYELLKLHARDGNQFAKDILKRMDETVSEWIIRDSPPERLKEAMRPRRLPGSLAFYMNDRFRSRYDAEVDMTLFKTKTSSMASKAVKYAAKSASVFNPAIDKINPALMFQQDSWAHYEVRQTLRDSHAFDQGDNKSIDWIDSQRREIGGRGPYGYDDYVFDCGSWEADGTWRVYETYEDFSYGKLHSIASESSSYTQAADIAAGFARQDYERYGIAAVAGRFDYVTLNGERITQNNAEKKFEFWRQLIEREQREHPQIVVFN